MHNLQIEIYQSNQTPQKYGRGLEAKDNMHSSAMTIWNNLLFNDSEKEQAERQAQEDEKAGGKKDEKEGTEIK
ncbi:hypothetical protein BELL_0041g00320 [Botrytis elliptica]|uniref:Uncharacterized protein n=1 Tax=Botrytis elliptica TaxID=278938 RepID=A0A4Z1KCU1_9HELO|nr:hypothetical protein BELL_0041g00320 [Botrytis elliptica]